MNDIIEGDCISEYIIGHLIIRTYYKIIRSSIRRIYIFFFSFTHNFIYKDTLNISIVSIRIDLCFHIVFAEYMGFYTFRKKDSPTN